eukprot:TRINITY_DN55671_c0_g1_i1.p1 TRINITY_DN55671_c0_g1~~TRINITY_DN55671_c0_g1_i1.p1  ORF type:complete len:1067 (-),score=165.57 TRINITY_DN55671_c0_g1_i1:148-3276(-)
MQRFRQNREESVAGSIRSRRSSSGRILGSPAKTRKAGSVSSASAAGSSISSCDSIDQAELRDDLAETRYLAALENFELQLVRAFDLLDSTGLKMAPYLKFTGYVRCSKTPAFRVRQASDGKKFEVRQFLQKDRRPVLDLLDEDPFGVVVEVFLKHTMRNHTLCGRGNLSAAAIFDSMSRGFSGRCQVTIQLFKGRTKHDGNVKPEVNSKADQGTLSKELTGEVTLSLLQIGTLKEIEAWEAAKVRRWVAMGSAPTPLSLEDCHKAVEILSNLEGLPLLTDVIRTTNDIALEQVTRIAHGRSDSHGDDVQRLVGGVKKLAEAAERSFVMGALANQLLECRERVADYLIETAMQSQDCQKMKTALLAAIELDCVERTNFANCEREFRSVIRVSEHVPLGQLFDALVGDEVARDPRDGGIDLVEDNPSLPVVEDRVRYGARDEVAQRVLVFLGATVQLQPSQGLTYETTAPSVISDPGFKIPVQAADLMRRVILFDGEPDIQCAGYAETLRLRRRHLGSLKSILRRFELCAQPVCAEFGADFKPILTSGGPAMTGCIPTSSSRGKGVRADVSAVGGPGWFWVLHGAAINVGESIHADDFPEYSTCSSKLPWRASGSNEMMVLDEERFVETAGQLWRNAFHAAVYLNAEDFIVFPWGMGAFLRNLFKLDAIYKDAAKMRCLRSRLAECLFEAAADMKMSVESPPSIHVCLMDDSLESRINHNVIVERGIAAVKRVPELARHLKFYRNVDAFMLANRLSRDPKAASTHRPDEVRRIVMLNGANNKLLGNHWFSNGARTAIDENLHRRSTAMSLGSLLLNGGAATCIRESRELASNVRKLGGQVVQLPIFVSPGRGTGREANSTTDCYGGAWASAAVIATAEGEAAAGDVAGGPPRAVVAATDTPNCSNMDKTSVAALSCVSTFQTGHSDAPAPGPPVSTPTPLLVGTGGTSFGIRPSEHARDGEKSALCGYDLLNDGARSPRQFSRSHSFSAIGDHAGSEAHPCRGDIDAALSTSTSMNPMESAPSNVAKRPSRVSSVVPLGEFVLH